ncbi:MBL fold metallo-hydrolase [Actinomadura decatromicini]|uniref:MBL fold metallo-hydrolase n=1 Tax=Actinomadura decatromicini TaxID=2604572 RepID=A0A5D3F5T6_9ACTN|nr:MBL fold metallo-hydrolase [Actinomadura decatromicini]TYK43482.1 MBL fold metallo-hydrolase [Actinomadura decatromicini]
MRLDASVDLVGGGRLGPGLSNAYDSNVYLLHGEGGGWLVDTGSGLDQAVLLGRVREALGGRPLRGAVITHAHADHAGGAAGLAARGVTVVAGPRTAELVRDGDPGPLGLTAALRAGIYPSDYRFAPCPEVRATGSADLGPLRALPTPGHSADHTSYLFTAGGTTYACTGDLLFGRGRIVLPGAADADVQQLRRSLERLRDARPDVLLPGHGTPVMADASWHIEQALAAFELGRLPTSFT